MVSVPPSLQGALEALGRLRSRPEPRRWIGLDLGSASLKLVELEQTAGGPRLVKHLIQDLPAGAAPGADRAGWLQAALKEFDAERLHVSLSGPEVALRRVQMPLMSRRELAEAVKWQVKEQIPFPVAEAVLDVQVVGEVWDKDIKKQDVLVAVASRSAVESVVALLERSGAHVASLVPTPFAAWRSAAALVPGLAQGSVAMIEVGARGTQVTIAKDGHIRLIRDLNVGSASVAEALVGPFVSERGEIAIDHAKAQALIRRYGVFIEDTEGATEEGVSFFHLSSLMRPVLEHLLTELSRVLAFYKVQMDEAGVSRAILCGGGATLNKLQAFLADGLGIPVEVFNPLAAFPPEGRAAEPAAEHGPRLAAAIGLALEHGAGLNLAPRDLPGGASSAVPRRLWIALARGAAVAAAALYLGLEAAAGLCSWRAGGHARVWKLVEPGYAQSMRLTVDAKALDGETKQLQQFIDRQPVWDGIMKELGELTPATIQLSELSFHPGTPEGPFRMTVRGRAAPGAERDGTGSIAAFQEALEASLFFSDVELASSEMRSGGSGETSFELEASLE
jgi:type IV pilus assembly protein PilM